METSMSTNTHTSDNSWFDPPIENYRFYYQSGDSTPMMTTRGSAKQSGFILRNNRSMRLEGDVGSERGNKSAHVLSSSSRNLFGSTISRGPGGSVDRGDETVRTDEKDSQNTGSYQ